MIEKLDQYIFLVSCDFCSYEHEYDLEFLEVVEKIKRTGWRISKVDDEWIHMCPICAGNEDLFG